MLLFYFFFFFPCLKVPCDLGSNVNDDTEFLNRFCLLEHSIFGIPAEDFEVMVLV